MWARAGEVGMDGDPRRIVVIDNPDEPMEPLLEAIRDTKGNLLQAARRLNTLGVPTRSGRPWDPRVLARCLDRVGATRTLRAGKVGERRAPSDAPLSRLVLCHCGGIMTATRDPRTKRWSSLYCNQGHKAGVEAHGRYIARSRHVMEMLEAELRISRITITKSGPADTTGDRASIEARRRKLGIAFADDAISETDYRERMDAIKRDLAKLDEGTIADDWTGFSEREPLIDWTADDAEVGERLRRLVRSVRLNENMMPVSVDWRAPWLARAKAS
jgi:hypothetical protein